MYLDNKRTIGVWFVLVLIIGMLLCIPPVAGQPSDGEISVNPSQVSLDEGESQTIAVEFQSSSDLNPTSAEYNIEYDEDVISVTSQNQGGYLGGDVIDKDISAGTIGYGESSGNTDGKDGGTISTITIEPASGANASETTVIKFTNVVIGEVSDEVTVLSVTKTDGSVEITEDIPEKSNDGSNDGSDNEEPSNETGGEVQIKSPEIGGLPVSANTASSHDLNFEVENISADGEVDNFDLTLPEEVTVEDITSTSVTDSTDNNVELVGTNPAAESNPDREVEFSVDPEGGGTRTLSVEVAMELSATS